MSDPTQVPPFAGSCRVQAGVVVELTGNANQHWCDQNDAVLIPDGLPVDIGWLYDGATFTDPNPIPETLPEEA